MFNFFKPYLILMGKSPQVTRRINKRLKKRKRTIRKR
jgi:hypothetical protein